jgi:hypothetical protein
MVGKDLHDCRFKLSACSLYQVLIFPHAFVTVPKTKTNVFLYTYITCIYDLIGNCSKTL